MDAPGAAPRLVPRVRLAGPGDLALTTRGEPMKQRLRFEALRGIGLHRHSLRPFEMLPLPFQEK